MIPVEYRFFQYQIHITSGDKVTIGLLFSDGQRLRFARSLGMLPRGLPDGQQELIERSLQALEVRLEATKRELRTGPLQEVFPVREGIGSALFWSELRAGETGEPEALFRELCEELDLAPPREEPSGSTREDLERGEPC